MSKEEVEEPAEEADSDEGIPLNDGVIESESEASDVEPPVPIVHIDTHYKDPIEKLLDEYDWEEGMNGRMFEIASGRRVGEITVLTMNKPLIRCKCMWHDSCAFLIPGDNDYHDKYLAALRWIHQGKTCDKALHEEAAKAVKRSLGITPHAARNA